MAVLRTREIVPTEKTTPKNPKATRNDNGRNNIEPCTPNQTKEPSPPSDPHPISIPAAGSGPGLVRRRSLRLATKAGEPESGGRCVRRRMSELREGNRDVGDGMEEVGMGGSASEGAGLSSGFQCFADESESREGKVGVLSLRSGRKVAKRGGGGAEFGKEAQELGNSGEESERMVDGNVVECDGDGSVRESRKGKRKMSGSNEEDVFGDGGGVSYSGRRRFSREEMGKGKLDEGGSVSNANGGDNSGLGCEVSDHNIPDKGMPDDGRKDERRRSQMMERFRETARENASRFALFSGEEVEEVRELPAAEVDDEPDADDWPGPFSTAWKIIKDRERRSFRVGGSLPEKGKPADVEWVPKNSRDRKRLKASVPSLVELSLKCLLDNADNLVSLDHVPDSLRHWMSKVLSDSRRMNVHFFRLLLQGSPMEVRVWDCSCLTEEELTKSLQEFDPSNLIVLQLDHCGRCLPDYVLLATLARSSNNLPALTTISLSGACRLSDVGLGSLVSSAPALRSLNLSQCSLLTYSSIETIANSLGSTLRKLYLDDCQGIDAMLMLPALKKIEHLELLSVAGIESVCDDFISEFISVRGHSMKELILTDCIKLTDSSVKVIAEKCPGLCAIDLAKCKLTDNALAHLANGCQSIQILKLCRSPFSDKSIAAFLETSGECLEELSLNNVRKVGCQTALSIARRSRKLQSLDLSWCRDLTDNALGLIVDTCLSLKVLKLFGCTQITDIFLNGHSNPEVKIIGLKMSPVLEHF